jgi:uncharacterized ParB-like nuclease family protein
MKSPPIDPWAPGVRAHRVPVAITNDVSVADIIVIPNRKRRLRLDVVNELAESIAAQGLLHPITLRKCASDGAHVLVAGHHRLEAVRKLGHESIRALVLDGIDADRAQLVEIDENLIRADLTPAERAAHQGDLRAAASRDEGGRSAGKGNECCARTWSPKWRSRWPLHRRRSQEDRQVGAVYSARGRTRRSHSGCCSTCRHLTRQARRTRRAGQAAAR